LGFEFAIAQQLPADAGEQRRHVQGSLTLGGGWRRHLLTSGSLGLLAKGQQHHDHERDPKSRAHD